MIKRVHEERGTQTSTQTSTQTGTQTTIQLVLSAIKENPQITREELMKKIGKSEKTIKNCIGRLKSEKKIVREGSSTFGGKWKVME